MKNWGIVNSHYHNGSGWDDYYEFFSSWGNDPSAFEIREDGTGQSYLINTGFPGFEHKFEEGPEVFTNSLKLNFKNKDDYKNELDEWNEINMLVKTLGETNKLSLYDYKDKLDRIRKNICDNIKIGISDEKLIRQIGLPYSWELDTKTEKAYLYYLDNRIDGSYVKYKRRFVIDHGVFNGYEDGEFNIDSSKSSYKVTFKDFEAYWNFFIENKLTIFKKWELAR